MRRLLLRALTALLAIGFALPSCFTMMVWQDHRRGRAVNDNNQAELLEVVPADAEHPTRIALQLPKRALVLLHQQLSEIPEATPWLLVEPTAYPETMTALVEQGASLAPSLHIKASASGPVEVELRCWLSIEGAKPALWNLPGNVQAAGGAIETRSLVIPCRLLSADTLPPAAGPASFRDFTIEQVCIRDDGTSTVARVLMTPLTVVLDTVLLPVELVFLVWWL